MLFKNQIPILEYDDNQEAVLKPAWEHEGLVLPEKALLLFIDDEIIDEFLCKYDYELVVNFESVTRLFPIYKIKIGSEEIAICKAGVGSALASSILDFLIALGVKKVIASGSCGVLVDIGEGEFILPYRALRDEGTSYHYLAPSRFIEIDEKIVQSMEDTLSKLGINYKKVITWTTDGLYRETKDMVKHRLSEGIEVVEMECSALAAVCKFRGIDFGQILFSADSLANLEKHDPRNYGLDSHLSAIEISLECLLKLT